jgi:hypothetical protein
MNTRNNNTNSDIIYESPKEVILDLSLTTKEIVLTATQFNSRRFFNIEKGFEQVTPLTNYITHRNYLDYLALCWNYHYGVVISPTILWNMVLCNLAYEVNKNPEKYRKYFTKSEEKIEIMVEQGGELIDPALLIAGLQGSVPTRILDAVFPPLSTDTEKSRFANYTAFLDMASPYYNYSMYLCGIPKIMILGVKNDWLHIIHRIGMITAVIPECDDYLFEVATKISDIADNNIDYKDFFSLERCGSGHQVMVSGWIKDFFIEKPKVSYPENFVPCISKFDYHNYNNDTDYRLYAGLFSSKIEGDYLVPSFESVYYKKMEEMVTKSTKSNDNTPTVDIKIETKTVKGDIIKTNDIDQSEIKL